MEEKNERQYSSTCMACGWGEGGGQRMGQMRRAGAKKGGGGGAKKGAALVWSVYCTVGVPRR